MTIAILRARGARGMAIAILLAIASAMVLNQRRMTLIRML